MVSCTLESYETPVEETYTREFIKEFGLIDSNQDWNMATRQSVTVNTAKSSQVKIFAVDNGSYKMVANYSDVIGQQTLGFDVVRDASEVLVISDSHAKIVSVGGSVDFTQNATRSINTYEDADLGIKVVATDDDEYKYFGANQEYGDVTQFTTILPEEGDNRAKVTNNFYGTTVNGKTTITMYPVFWNTGHGTPVEGNNYDNYPDEIGIAYKDESGTIQRVPIYTIKSGDELQGSNDLTNWTSIDSAKNGSKGTYNAYNFTYYRSKGINITLPKNFVYGFYVSVHENVTALGDGYNVYNYSVAEWNDAPYYTASYYNGTKNADATGHAVYVGTYKDSKGHTYMAFEDWSDNTTVSETKPSDHDMNDVVVMFDPEPDIVDEGDQDEWIIAGEDLGNMDDWDFNDIVISVKHLAGETTATVKALAAGGTLPVYLYRDGTALNGGLEFHKWFGDDLTSGNVINTYAGSDMKEGESITIEVPSNFTMSSYDEKVGNMGGFTFKVTGKDGVTTTDVTSPQNGTAPQMICVPSTWLWPIERTNISDAYTGFGEWGANYTNSGWLATKVAGKVVER